MREKWNVFVASLDETTVMSKRSFLLTTLTCLLGGLVLGMLFSPRKTVVIGSNNGNDNVTTYGGELEEEE